MILMLHRSKSTPIPVPRHAPNITTSLFQHRCFSLGIDSPGAGQGILNLHPSTSTNTRTSTRSPSGNNAYPGEETWR